MSIIKTILKKWYVLVGFVLVGVLVGIVTQEDKYQSDAGLMFKLGREHLYQPEFGNRQPIASTRSDLANAINTETHIMGSADVLRAAVRQVGAKNIITDASVSSEISDDLIEQTAVDLISDDLSIRSIEGTNVVQLNYSHQSPEIARQTLNAIIDAFLEYRKEIYGDSSLQLMQEKLSENQSALKSAEKELQIFAAKQNIYSYQDQLNSVTEQLIAADRSRQNLSAEKSEVDVQLQLTTERISTTATSISLFSDTATNSLYDDAQSRIFALQMERNQLRGRYHDSSERVTQVVNELAQLEKYIKTQNRYTTRSERKGRNPALDSLISRKIELGNKRDSILSKQESQANLIGSLQQKRNELNALGAEFEQKQSAVDVLKERQLTYVDEVDKAKLAMDINNSVRSGARILQRASLPITRSGITGLDRMKLSALVGLLFAIALLMARSVFSGLNIFPESGERLKANTVENSLHSGNSGNVQGARPVDESGDGTGDGTEDEIGYVIEDGSGKGSEGGSGDQPGEGSLEKDLVDLENDEKKIAGIAVLGKIGRA